MRLGRSGANREVLGRDATKPHGKQSLDVRLDVDERVLQQLEGQRDLLRAVLVDVHRQVAEGRVESRNRGVLSDDLALLGGGVRRRKVHLHARCRADGGGHLADAAERLHRLLELALVLGRGRVATLGRGGRGHRRANVRVHARLHLGELLARERRQAAGEERAQRGRPRSLPARLASRRVKQRLVLGLRILLDGKLREPLLARDLVVDRLDFGQQRIERRGVLCRHALVRRVLRVQFVSGFCLGVASLAQLSQFHGLFPFESGKRKGPQRAPCSVRESAIRSVRDRAASLAAAADLDVPATAPVRQAATPAH